MALRLRTWLFSQLPSTPGDVLEIGCGRGDLGDVLAARGWRVTGVEPSPLACSAARANGLAVLQGTVDDVPLPSAAYDVAIFHHSLEHVTDPTEALRRVRAALRPGGSVLIAVPNFGSRDRRRLGVGWWGLDPPRHRFHFTVEALRRSLVGAGFVDVRTRATASVLGPAANLSIRLRGGRFVTTGPLFLAGYGLATLAYPVTWTLGVLRGPGDYLNAVAVTPLC
jgi:SAM-dependent methyltransferase